MFSGIVEEIGTLNSAESTGGLRRLTIGCSKVLEDAQIGDSIAVDGVCQTVVSLGPQSFTVEAVKETLERTTLGSLKQGDQLNLERSLQVGQRISGHLVSGHVDGRGRVLTVSPVGEGRDFEIGFPAELARYIAQKGSITVSGVSLTVGRVKAASFELHLIPHTLHETTLHLLKAGGEINLEVDILARYVERMLSHGQSDGGHLTMERLRELGYTD